MRPVLTFRENFLREMLLSYQSVKVFSLENFLLYGIPVNRDTPLLRNHNYVVLKHCIGGYHRVLIPVLGGGGEYVIYKGYP